MNEEDIEILKEISSTLDDINNRQKTNEILSESDSSYAKREREVEYSTHQIQNSFDRIHDKVFNLNNILIGSFAVLGTYLSEEPIIKIWTIIFPIINLIFLIYLEINQMNIHRFASNQMSWTEKDIDLYGRKISNQTGLSLISFALSFLCLLYLVIRLF